LRRAREHRFGDVDPDGASGWVQAQQLAEHQAGADGDFEDGLTIAHLAAIETPKARFRFGEPGPEVVDGSQA
jgi:hypothetical protein